MINGFSDVQKIGAESMNRALQSFNALSRGWQSLADEMVAFSKRSFEEGAAHLDKLAAAKSLDAASHVQANYLRASYEKSVDQAARLGELYLDTVKGATKPFDGVRAAAK
jgi:hypothetical protein